MKGKKVNWNKKLMGAGYALRVSDGYTRDYILLSNGVEIQGITSVGKFGRRLNSGWNIDLAYHVSEKMQTNYIKEQKSIRARKGGINCQKQNPHIREIAKENFRKARESGKNQEWHKEKASWNKGLTKETDSRLMEYSRQKTGEGNPMFGYSPTKEERQRASNKMKENIKSGKFTPNIRNSQTHWQVEYKGKKFRSSWEAAFYALNPTFEYEKIRISYWLDDKEKIYIVDFYDPENKLLVEIKPKEHTYSEQFKAKQAAAKKWVKENGYHFEVFTQEYLKANMEELLLSDLPEKVKDKLKKIKVKTWVQKKEYGPISIASGMVDPDFFDYSAGSFSVLAWKNIKDHRPILALTQAWCNTLGHIKGRSTYDSGNQIKFEYKKDADAYSAFESHLHLGGKFSKETEDAYTFLEEGIELYRKSLNESR